MQFTAHLDEIDGSYKLPPKKLEQKPKKEEAVFSLKVEKGGSFNNVKKVQEQAVKAPHTEKVEIKEGNSPWPLIRNVLFRVLASVLIFLIGYIALNWSAFSLIFERRISQFTNPASNQTETPINFVPLQISNDPKVQKKQIPGLNLTVTPPDMRILIPKINSNLPVVPVPTENLIARDWSALENDIQEALRDGVVHYPGTAYPDQIGNVVITGHSSYFPWDPGRFKDVFALLHDVELNDEIVVYYNQKKFVYRVDEKKVVMPDQIDVLGPTDDSRLTLITCTPIGTNQKRLIIRAKLIEGELIDGTKVKLAEAA